jgi:hypothetical protein
MTSKWLLHHSPCTSPLSDFAPGSFFRRVIREGHSGDNMRPPLAKDKRGGKGVQGADTGAPGVGDGAQGAEEKHALFPPAKIRKVIFCSGKIFYHLYHARRAAGIQDTSFVRLEQIAPFPFDMVAKSIREYPNAELVWVQEEPRNMGAWSYIKPRFDTTVSSKGFPHQPIRSVISEPSILSPHVLSPSHAGSGLSAEGPLQLQPRVIIVNTFSSSNKSSLRLSSGTTSRLPATRPCSVSESGVLTLQIRRYQLPPLHRSTVERERESGGRARYFIPLRLAPLSLAVSRHADRHRPLSSSRCSR